MARPLLLYVHDLRGSGVVTNAIALARRMGSERETILVAGYGQGLNRSVDVSPARLVVLNDANKRASRLDEARRLRALLKRLGAPLAVSMGNLGHRSFFLATLRLPGSTVYRISNEVARPRRPLRNAARLVWNRLFLASADRVVLVGNALAKLPLFAAALKSGRAVYIPNGIDLDRAARLLRETSTGAGAGARETTVVTIGRIHPQKNLARLIDAVALANETRLMRLVIVGGGDAADVDALEQRARECGIGDRVVFAGETQNVFEWLKQADVFALASLWEGSSTALLEALAARVPVVASHQAGDAAHVLDGGRYGALVDANDSGDIAQAILRQLGPDAILPGERANLFDLRRTHDAYAALFAALG